MAVPRFLRKVSREVVWCLSPMAVLMSVRAIASDVARSCGALVLTTASVTSARKRRGASTTAVPRTSLWASATALSSPPTAPR